jgi:hypothetical protein
MSETGSKSKKKRSQRTFEAEALGLYSLRLIAAPRPEDDLSDAELSAITRNSSFSSEMIQQLIERIKTI